jgi:hypothetical protein
MIQDIVPGCGFNGTDDNFLSAFTLQQGLSSDFVIVAYHHRMMESSSCP